MSALPCSSILPWLENGLSPFGVLTLTWVLLSSLSRSTHSICKPSFSNRPSRSATSSGNPWNGAVVSSTSFFMGRAPRSESCFIPRETSTGPARPDHRVAKPALRYAGERNNVAGNEGGQRPEPSSFSIVTGSDPHAIQHPDPGRGLWVAAGLQNAVRRAQDPSHLPA